MISRAALFLLAGYVLLAGFVAVPAANAAPPPDGVKPSAAQPTALSQPATGAAAPARAPSQGPAPGAPPVVATPPTDEMVVATAGPTLQKLEDQLAAATSDANLAAIGAQAGAIEAAADRDAQGLSASLEGIDNTLSRLNARGHRRTVEALEATAPLERQRTSLLGALHQAQGVASSASAIFRDVAQRRREGFSARLLERSPSPVNPVFWTSLAEASSQDFARVQAMAQRSVISAWRAPEPRGLVGVVAGLVLAALVVVVVRPWLSRLGRRLWADPADSRGFARAATALWIALVDGGTPALAANIVRYGLGWGDLLTPAADTLVWSIVGAVAWSAAILALGRAFTTVLDPGRRLFEPGDRQARRIRRSLAAVALVTSAGFILRQVNYAVGASVAATIASNCVLSLAYAGVAVLILVAFQRGHSARAIRDGATPTSPVWTLVSLALTLAIVVTIAAVLSGYTTLASLISGQIFWLSLIGAATLLLLRFADEGLVALFDANGATTRALATLFSLMPSTIVQAGLILSALLQILILIAAATLALTPFGQSGEQLFSHVGRIGSALQIGKVKVSPIAIAEGLGVLAIGMGSVNLVRGWVVRRYLPATGWDAGIQNSVSTGVSYLGVGVTLICAFSAMGLGFQQIALIASALSVGIGFGLQQIVQNFVSGVILLVERPVKVGDWVDLGSGVEGDVRRIRVRATEIQTFDRTTVIVPNSTFITSNVRNKTLGDPRGRVELKLTIAKAADAARARQLMLEASDAHEEVLKDPAPSAFVDSTATAGAINLKGFAFVANARAAYRVRSEIYLDILARYVAADIALGG